MDMHDELPSFSNTIGVRVCIKCFTWQHTGCLEVSSDTFSDDNLPAFATWVPTTANDKIFKKILMLPIQRGYDAPLQDNSSPPLSFETVQVAAHEYFIEHARAPRHVMEWVLERMCPRETFSTAQANVACGLLENALNRVGDGRVLYKCLTDDCAGWV